jgi:hypothetical protein
VKAGRRQSDQRIADANALAVEQPIALDDADRGPGHVLTTRFPFGAPCGDPENRALHEAVVVEALALLGTATSPGTVVASRHAWRRDPGQ